MHGGLGGKTFLCIIVAHTHTDTLKRAACCDNTHPLWLQRAHNYTPNKTGTYSSPCHTHTLTEMYHPERTELVVSGSTMLIRQNALQTSDALRLKKKKKSSSTNRASFKTAARHQHIPELMFHIYKPTWLVRPVGWLFVSTSPC